MNVLSDRDLAELTTNYPLYSKMFFSSEMGDGDAVDVKSFFNNKPFKHYCPICKDSHTFKFTQVQSFRGDWSLSKFDGAPVVNDKVSYSFDRAAKCQMCEFRMDFFFNIFSEENYRNEGNVPALYIRKIGQYPAIARNPEGEVLKYLIEEDRVLYSKALSNLSVSYGIGAYAYFRRIIENEIKRFVLDISTLDYDEADKVKDAYAKYLKDHQMSALITSINPYMPPSLMRGGQNPLKILHGVTSEGIHIMSEEECLAKAKDIDALLRYTIKTISRLKFDDEGLSDAIKNLTSS